MVTSLCSGLAGAILVQFASMIWHCHNVRKEFKALRMSMLAECDYVLSIIDEVRDGSVGSRISFKRLPVDYFRAIHKELIKYTKNHELFRLVSKVFVDMDLFNREVEFMFTRKLAEKDISGVIGREVVSLKETPGRKDISEVIRCAAKGVKDGIMHMKNYLGEEYGTENADEL